MQQNDQEFEIIYQEFMEHQLKEAVPPRVKHKLLYLASRILGTPPPQDTSTDQPLVEDGELEHLDAIDAEGKRKLFISVAKCVIGKENLSFVEKRLAYIRKDSWISLFWHTCYIRYDSQTITIMRNDKQDHYDLNDIKVSSRVKQYPKINRYYFVIELRKEQYFLGLDSEESCKQLHGIIKKLIISKIARTYRASSRMLQNNNRAFANLSNCLSPRGSQHLANSFVSPCKSKDKIDSLTESRRNVQALASPRGQKDTSNFSWSCFNQPSMNTMKKITRHLISDPEALKRLQQWRLDNNSQFQIEQFLQHGTILRSNNNPNVFKFNLRIQLAAVQTDPSIPLCEQVMCAYWNMNEWNIELDSFKTLCRIGQNKYLVCEKHRPSSLLSWPRDFLLMKSAHRINEQRYYIMEKSVQNSTYPPTKQCYRGIIEHRVTEFRRVGGIRDTGTICIAINGVVNINYKGYCTAADTKCMLLKHLSNSLAKFPAFCRRKIEMNGETVRIFDFQQCNTTTTNQNVFSTSRSSMNEQRVLFSPISSLQEQDIRDSQTTQMSQINQNLPLASQLSARSQLLDLIQILPKNQRDSIRQEIFALINKKVHHFLPVSQFHNFTLKVDSDSPKLKGEGSPDNFLLQNGDWVFREGGQVVFVNTKKIDAQKDVIKYIVREIGSNLLKGKSILNMSLPVDIFDRRSLLERLAAAYGYAPHFLHMANQCDDQLQEMKYISTFIISTALLQLRIEKPFNPILGQTFTGLLAGIPIFWEQISHHPPVSAFFMECDDFKMWGCNRPRVDMGLNSAVGVDPGLLYIKLKNKANRTYECSFPTAQISGMLYGERQFKITGHSYLYCVSNPHAEPNKNDELFAEVYFGNRQIRRNSNQDAYRFDKKSRQSTISGGIFTVTHDFLQRYRSEPQKTKIGGLLKKDVVNLAAAISGEWTDKIMFGDQVLKSRYEPLPYSLQYYGFPLASDSNYREDVLNLRMGNLVQAQVAKEALEDQQRQDRKLRSQFQHFLVSGE